MNIKTPALYKVKYTDKMSSIQAKITTHANKQENRIYNEKKNQSVYTD